MSIKIISSKLNMSNIQIQGKALIIIHLYYLDTIHEYIDYIKCIPEQCDVLFTSSSLKHHTVLEKLVKGKSNWYIVDKQNRGRDISALLVAGKAYYNNYDYVCFVHDKKEKGSKLKESVHSWAHSMWGNMLGSRNYICNILRVFEENKSVGLCIPPAPLDKFVSAALINTWYSDYENTVKLAQKLKIRNIPDINEWPEAVGSVFWARVSAMKKLFEMDWSYDDFLDEPLPVDGELNHAIERILPYIAKDAGYETITVMNEEFMENRYELLMDIGKRSLSLLKQNTNYQSVYDIFTYDERRDALLEFLKRFKNIYFYGAGKLAKQCMEAMKGNSECLKGVFVTELHGNQEFYGLCVKEWNTGLLTSEEGIIVTVGFNTQEEIVKYILDTDKSIQRSQIFLWI